MGRTVGGFGMACRLARRELRGGLRGLRVFWLCLMLGVAIIAAVGSISASIVRGLDADSRALLGGDVSVQLNHRPATPDQFAYLERAGRVSSVVNFRTMLRTRDNSARQLVELKAVDGAYPLYGDAQLEPTMSLRDALARDADGVWGAVVDPTILELLDVSVGERVSIGEGAFQIRAKLLREPDRTGRSMLFGATTMVALESLPATALIKPGSLATYAYRVRFEEPLDVDGWVEGLNAAFPDAGWRVRTFTNATPRVERFVENLADFLQLVGLTTLLVGGVGVSNAIASYLKTKTRTIATLKCLGASSRVVFLTYLLQTLALASTGVLCGLAVGAAAPAVVGRILGDALPVEIALRVFPRPLLLAAAYGILTALVFSIWPLAGVRDVPAGGIFRSAILPTRSRPTVAVILAVCVSLGALGCLAVFSSRDRGDALWFLAGASVTLLLFLGAGRLAVAGARAAGRPKRPSVRLALTNLHRPDAPTGHVVLSLGLGLTVVIAIALVQGNLAAEVSTTIPAQAPNFFFIDIQPDQVEAFDAMVAGTPGGAELERVPMLRGRIIEIRSVPVEELTIPSRSSWVVEGDRQLTWARTPPGDTEVTVGAWWQSDYAGPPLISIEEEIAEDFGVTVGDTLTFNILGRRMEAEIASIRHVNWESMGINFAVVFSPGVLESVPHTHMATARVDPRREARLERAVTDRFPNITVFRPRALIGAVLDVLRRIGMAVRLVAGVAILAGILVLAGAVATEHRRRVYDAVVLKVLGATRRDLVKAYGMEYGLLGLITVFIAAGIGSAVSYAVVTWVMHFEWRFLPRTLATTGLLGVGLTLAVGMLGTWRTLSHPASQTLRNE